MWPFTKKKFQRPIGATSPYHYLNINTSNGLLVVVDGPWGGPSITKGNDVINLSIFETKLLYEALGNLLNDVEGLKY